MNRFNDHEKGYLLVSDSFDPVQIVACGQAFRWKVEEDGSITLIAHNRILNLLKTEEGTIFRNTTIEDIESIWWNYFDLDTDYLAIKQRLQTDPILEQAIRYGCGIRILNQDRYETIISFILSANNHVPRIKGCIEKIATRYGEPIGTYQNTMYYTFPKPKVLAKLDPLELRETCKVGFRDQRIVETSKRLLNEDRDLLDRPIDELENLKKRLMALPGIGDKVSDCILLFAMKKKETFPVDVWIKRVMEELYLKRPGTAVEIQKRAQKEFNDLAGVAQQYLFYYGREEKIGK